jgi:hypothetical protein
LPIAQSLFASMYRDGKGVGRDQNESLQWLKRAAENGYPAAQFNLGFSYATGSGATVNLPEAVKWFRLSAEQGFAASENALGYAYGTGQGVGQDFIEAYKWCSLAQAQKNGNAEANLRNFVLKMTPEQIAAGKAAAAAFSPKTPFQ